MGNKDFIKEILERKGKVHFGRVRHDCCTIYKAKCCNCQATLIARLRSACTRSLKLQIKK